MKGEGVKGSTVTYNSLIDTCVRNGQMHKAWDILTNMLKE